MARKIDILSDAKVRSLRTPGYHADGGGLYLQVSSSLSKSWVFAYTRDKKSREMGLGPLLAISLADARKRAATCRTQLADGLDPIEGRDAQRAREAIERASIKTFQECAEAFIEVKRKEWKNEKHGNQWSNTLEQYCYPVFGDWPIRNVDTAAVLRAVRPIWETINETAGRVRGRIESVLDWATANGFRTGDNPARWSGLLEHLLPDSGQIAATGHHSALPYARVPDFMQALRNRKSDSALALELTILTKVRTENTIAATRGEFDLDAAIWTIPPGRMKGKKNSEREHVVPLCSRAVEIVREQLQHRGNFLFPGTGKSKHMSTGAMLELVKEMHDAAPEGWKDQQGDRITVHGFRSSFTDWAADETDYPEEVRKMALAHAIGDKVEAAYRRGNMFKKRQALAQDWSDYCDGLKPLGENVIPLRRAAN